MLILTVLAGLNIFMLGLQWWGDRSALSLAEPPTFRADWVGVQTPWVNIDPATPQASTAAPRVDLRRSAEQLDAALALGEAAPQQPALECRLWGPLLASESTRVQNALATWPGRVSREQKGVPVGYVVYLPAEQVRAGLDEQALRRLGVTEVFLLADPGPLQGSISLGLFRQEERAGVHRAELLARGVAGVQIRERLGPERTFFRLEANPADMAQLVTIYEANRRGQLVSCSASPEAN